MKPTTEQTNKTRKSRTFWVNHENAVVERLGYECPYETQWWFPDIGYTLSVGYHLFNTEQEAIAAAIKETEKAIEPLNKALIDLKNRLWKITNPLRVIPNGRDAK